MSAEWSYSDALQEIWNRSNYERGYIANPFGDEKSGRRGLARVQGLLHLAGDPHHRQLIAHVAGSKGKGSTAAMIGAIGQAAGYRVGLYTSPHLHSFRERVAVDATPIAEPDFARLTQRVAGLAARLEAARPEFGQITTFELLTAMALVHFEEAGCGLVVLEVGLGGTYDATNVVTPAVSVITRLDLEHTAILGLTLEAIAAAKAGIIKPGIPVVASPPPGAAAAVLADVAAARQSPLLVGGRDWHWAGTWRAFTADGPWGTYASLTTGLPGAHQMENAATAIAAISILNTAGRRFSERDVRRGLREVQLQGRFEQVPLANDVVVIFDGAHTRASARALAAAVRAEFPDRDAIVVLGTSADKDIASLGRELRAIASRFIATASANPRAARPPAIAAGLAGLALPVESQPSVPHAVTRAIELARPGELIVITGSLFVVADAREALGLGIADPPFGHR